MKTWNKRKMGHFFSDHSQEIALILIILVFGTKKLRTLGGDLGSAIKGFKKAMNDDDDSAKKTSAEEAPAQKLSHKE